MITQAETYTKSKKPTNLPERNRKEKKQKKKSDSLREIQKHPISQNHRNTCPQENNFKIKTPIIEFTSPTTCDRSLNSWTLLSTSFQYCSQIKIVLNDPPVPPTHQT